MNRKGLFGLEDRIGALTPRIEPEAEAPGPLTWFSLASALPIVLGAFLLAAAADLALGRFWLDRGPGGSLGLEIGLQVLGLALFAGAVLAAAVTIPAAALVRPGARGRAAGLVLGVLLAAAWLIEARALFAGEGFKRLENAELIRWAALGLGALAALFVGRALVRRFIHPRAEVGACRRGLLAAALFIALGLALMVADARLLVGGYPGAHRLALLGALLLFAAGLTELGILLEDRMPNRGGRLWPLVLVLGLIGLGLLARGRTLDSVHALRERLLAPDHPFARKLLAPIEGLLLDHIIAVPKPPERDAGELVARAFPAPASSRALDQLLGEGRRRFNVVIIAADTLRHDVVGWSPDQRRDLDLTPNLDDFAGGSIVFERAHTPYPTSSYAYSSLLTGLYPRWSPARAALRPGRATDVDATLPLVLRREGYATWAATAFNAAGIDERGPFGHLRPGFDVINPRANLKELDAPEVTATALQLLDERDRERPFLLFVQYMDPHASYRRHEGFDFGSSARDLYHGEIAYMDRHMGPLLDRLEGEDLVDDTIVVFCSDHGEAFGEHDTSYHNSNLHDEQIRVPVFMRLPRVGPGRSDLLFNLVDLTPTLLGLTGHRDDRQRQGRDLAGPIAGLEQTPPVDFSYSERFPRDPLPGRGMERALVFQGRKLIRFAGDASARVFDLENDPLELQDVFDPEDEDHQLLLGFMSALDKRFDALLGGGPGEDLQAASIATAESALEALGDTDVAADFMPLFDLAKLLFDGEKRFRPEVAQALGPERMNRICRLLEAVAADESRPLLQRQTAFTFLIELPLDELEPFMLRCLQAPIEDARRGAALWLVRRGRMEGREILLASLDGGTADWCMTAAPPLAALGERRAAAYLLPGLERVLSDAAAESLAALGKLGHHDLDLILRELLAAGLPGLESRAGLVACVGAMATVFGPDADQLLARLAASPVPEARSTARAALESRASSARQATLAAMADQQILGDQALMENDAARALAAFDEARRIGAEVDLRDPFLELRAARCLALAGDRENAGRRVELLLEDEALRPRLRQEARALLEVLTAATPLEREVGDLKIRARLLRPDAPLPFRQGEFFARRLRIGNGAQERVLGGAWPRGLRLLWYFKDAEGNFVRLGGDRRLPARFLPPEGLEAAGSLEFVSIGRMPPRPGRYTPVLVLAREPWFSPGAVPLLELPPVEVW